MGPAREWTEPWVPRLQVLEPALLLICSVALGKFHNLRGLEGHTCKMKVFNRLSSRPLPVLTGVLIGHLGITFFSIFPLGKSPSTWLSDSSLILYLSKLREKGN